MFERQDRERSFGASGMDTVFGKVRANSRTAQPDHRVARTTAPTEGTDSNEETDPRNARG